MKKTAIVCEFLGSDLGETKLIEALSEVFQNPKIFCLSYEPSKGQMATAVRVLQKTVSSKKISASDWAYPRALKAIQGFDLSVFDTVISISNGLAHRVNVPEKARHVVIYRPRILRFLERSGFKAFWRNRFFPGFAPRNLNCEGFAQTQELLGLLSKQVPFPLQGFFLNSEIFPNPAPEARGRQIVLLTSFQEGDGTENVIRDFSLSQESLLVVSSNKEALRKARFRWSRFPHIEWATGLSEQAERDLFSKAKKIIVPERGSPELKTQNQLPSHFLPHSDLARPKQSS